MYLHLGQETVVKTAEIIGLFDIETTTIAKDTRVYLGQAEKRKQVVNVSYEIPKTFVIGVKGKDQRVYITPISGATLKKRCDSANREAGNRAGSAERGSAFE